MSCTHDPFEVQVLQNPALCLHSVCVSEFGECARTAALFLAVGGSLGSRAHGKSVLGRSSSGIPLCLPGSLSPSALKTVSFHTVISAEHFLERGRINKLLA